MSAERVDVSRDLERLIAAGQVWLYVPRLDGSRAEVQALDTMLADVRAGIPLRADECRVIAAMADVVDRVDVKAWTRCPLCDGAGRFDDIECTLCDRHGFIAVPETPDGPPPVGPVAAPASVLRTPEAGAAPSAIGGEPAAARLRSADADPWAPVTERERAIHERAYGQGYSAAVAAELRTASWRRALRDVLLVAVAFLAGAATITYPGVLNHVP